MVGRPKVLGQMRDEEVDAGLVESQTVIIPLGSLEQHGDHSPLSTDTLIACGHAHQAAALTGCFVAPPLPYGYTVTLLPGSVRVSPFTTSLALDQLLDSYSRRGFRHIILWTGHGNVEHVAAIQTAVDRFRNQQVHPAVRVTAPDCYLHWVPTGLQLLAEEDGHAGAGETSQVLVLRPDLVRSSKPVDPVELVRQRWQVLRRLDHPNVIPCRMWNPAVRYGTVGDPTRANAAMGQVLVQEAVTALVKLIREHEGRSYDTDPADLDAHPWQWHGTRWARLPTNGAESDESSGLMTEMTVKDVRVAMERTDTVIVPLGGAVPIGPGLPVGTTTIIAEGLAREAARSMGCLVAAPVTYGPCGSNTVGAVGMSSDTCALLLQEICSALVDPALGRIRNIILCPGHISWTSENLILNAIGVLLRELRRPEIAIALMPYWEVSATCRARTQSNHLPSIEGALLSRFRAELVGPTSPAVGQMIVEEYSQAVGDLIDQLERTRDASHGPVATEVKYGSEVRERYA